MVTLTAPCISPATDILCSGRMSNNSGTVATTEPAVRALSFGNIVLFTLGMMPAFYREQRCGQ